MASAVWKIPRDWTAPPLGDRAALYPALYLRWAGHAVAITPDPPPGRWAGADLRVMLAGRSLAQDEKALIDRTVARGQLLIVTAPAGLAAEDKAFLAARGLPLLAWTDAGPLASAPVRAGGLARVEAQGCAVRAAEEILLASELGWEPQATGSLPAGAVVVVAESADALAQTWPALERASAGRPVLVACEEASDLDDIRAFGMVTAVAASDPGLLAAIAGADVFLCLHPRAPPESARPGQWVRTALLQGAPVIALSHPSVDGLAHLCIMDDVERGLGLFHQFPGERLRAAAEGQSFLAPRLLPERIAADWTGLLAGEAGRRPAAAITPASTPTLLVLIDIHQDLDVLLPVLLALREREETRVRIAVTDWLVEGSPRVLNALAGHGLAFEVYPRDAVRNGEQPLLGGVDGVLSGAETSVRAHKAGHVLIGRARARGAATFTLQHGLENIGLTYRDALHGEDVRFAAETLFTWNTADQLAPWAAPETRAAVRPVGSPKAAPAPARSVPLNQGHWPRIIGVFENLHWHRFDDAYRDRVLVDLLAAADAHEETLFLVKPHHAGRWTSSHPDRVTQTANLVVIDPTDSAWEPHTAPALIASVDRVLTTPSTVALDAARSGRPVAILGHGLELPLYEPLPVVRSQEDLMSWLDEDDDGASLALNEAFLRRSRLEGRADHRIAAEIAAALRAVSGRGRGGRRSMKGRVSR